MPGPPIGEGDDEVVARRTLVAEDGRGDAIGRRMNRTMVK
jgi:hypothetical protein